MNHLETLTLLAIASGGQKGATTAATLTKLRPFAPAQSDRSEFDRTARKVIDALLDGGDISAASSAGSRSVRYALTARGKTELEKIVGELPAKTPTWGVLRDKLLLPMMFGVPKKVKPAFGLMRGLAIAQAIEGGGDIGPVKTEAELLNRLAAVVLQATRSDIPALREAMIRRWLAEPSVVQTAKLKHDSHKDFDYDNFARDVLEAAHTSDGGRVGSKVLVNHIWSTMKRAKTTHALDEPTFKAALLEANRRRLLSLSRADLSPSLSAEDVQASELDWHGDTFHFVELER